MPDELFPPDTGAADSPRLAWMKRHDIVTHDRGADYDRTGRRRWCAWSPSEKQRATEEHCAYGCPEAPTEDEALLVMAQYLGLRLWAEEAA